MHPGRNRIQNSLVFIGIVIWSIEGHIVVVVDTGSSLL